MWDDDEEIEPFETSIDRFLSRAFSGMDDPLFDTESRALRPLFRLEMSEGWVTVVFDLPGVKKEDVEVTCTEDMVSIEAEMRHAVSMRVSAGRSGIARFERYTKKVLLPVKVDPDKGTARYKNGMVVVKLPVLRGGKAVKILDRRGRRKNP